MRNFARLTGPDRAALFSEAKNRSGLPVSIVEKDFWVCWILERLWASPFAPHLLFKGGTSLSKCFNLIQRFSEDIDIGLDRSLLGFDGEKDPTAPGLSRSARNKRVDALKDSAKEWIETTFLDGITQMVRDELGDENDAGWNWEIEYDDGMPKLRWNPPLSQAKRRSAQAESADGYLNRGVLIEIGARAAHSPASHHPVSPYVAQHIPEAFTAPSVSVWTLEVARTFWEKATILHVLNYEAQQDTEANRHTRARERYSRHCYDLYCIASANMDVARDFVLLADVVRFKRTFFCSSTVKEAPYKDACPGTLRIVPHAALADFFAADYTRMQSSGMFFDEAPSWTSIQEKLKELEERINGD